MKDTFDNYGLQGRYILRLINNCTDIKKVCQLCGKPAKLKNNRTSPYEIQLICDDCKKTNVINPETKMYNFPTINVKDHLITKVTKSKNTHLNEEYVNKFNDILNGNYTKQQALKYLGVTQYVYDKLIKEYKYEYDLHIEEKLNKSYKKTRGFVLMRAKSNINSSNNLSKLKIERRITNEDILNKTGLTGKTLSDINNGLSIPKNTTCALIASVLHCSVKDIFPNYIAFSNVYNISTLRALMINTYDKIYYIWQGSKEVKYHLFLKELSEQTGIGVETIRNFIMSTKYKYSDINLDLLSNDNIVAINKIFESYHNVLFTTEKSNIFNEWKDKSKIRRRYLK